MKSLDIQDKLEYARSAVAVLRALQIIGQPMPYSEFAKAIGLISDEDGWQVWHRRQVTDILNTVAAVERQGDKSSRVAPLRYNLVVNKRTAASGTGISKNSKIVRK